MMQPRLIACLLEIGLRLFHLRLQRSNTIEARLKRNLETSSAMTSAPCATDLNLIGTALRLYRRVRFLRPTCLELSIIGSEMLFVRGIPSTIRLGVDSTALPSFRAHAWLESRGQLVLGPVVPKAYRFSRVRDD